MSKKLFNIIKGLDLVSRLQGATYKEIETELGVSNKTAKRLIDNIEEMGTPIFDDSLPHEKQKRWKVMSSDVDKRPYGTFPKIELQFTEMFSMIMLIGESTVFKGTEIDRYVQSALSKLMYFFTEPTQREISNLKKIIISKVIGSKTYTDKDHTITTLKESMLSRTTCKIKYRSFSKNIIKEVDIGPLHFYENNGGLYVFALKLPGTAASDVWTYAVERIQRIRNTNREFDYPDDFKPEDCLNSAFDMIHGDPVSVKIWFSQNVARYIKERPWSENQTIEDHYDGSLTLSMKTSGYRDVKMWVMSYGKEAELLEPEGMRREIMEDFEVVLKKIKKN